MKMLHFLNSINTKTLSKWTGWINMDALKIYKTLSGAAADNNKWTVSPVVW